MKQTTFWRCFLTVSLFSPVKTVSSDSSVITDLCLGCGRLHNAQPTTVKDLALIFWSVSLRHRGFIFCQKHFEQAFFYVFFHSHLMRCFVNGKSHCCNGTFTYVWFTLLLAKNIWYLRRKHIFMLLESAFH